MTNSTHIPELKQLYRTSVVPSLQKQFSYTNVLAVPRLSKVVVNVGLNAAHKDGKLQEVVAKTLTRITGQKPVFTKARKSISNFKIREDQVVGAKVTLRGDRMYDFVAKLIRIAFPRVRDFRGISPKSLDSTGNLNLGFREHIIFPEIKTDEIESMHGLEVALTSTARTRAEALAFFKLLGFPFAD